MDNCNHCGKDYALIPENAVLQTFLRNPECNYIQAQCPHCEGWMRIFVSVDSACALIEQLQVYVSSDATDELKAGHRKVFGSEDPIPNIIASEYEIPPSLEKEIRRLHDALNDPNFTDEMELPAPPPKLPERWRGDDNTPGAST